MFGVSAGVMVILWTTLSPRLTWWPEALRSPFHGLLVIVLGTLAVIIAGAADSLPTPLPKDVKILRDVSRTVYLDYVRRCSLVVLPLIPTERSTGQVVLLEAMALGKPVVASLVPGTTDLIRHGQNGMVVEPCSAGELAAAVRHVLDPPDLARQMGMSALEDVKKLYTFDIHAEAKLNAIRALWEASGAAARRTHGRPDDSGGHGRTS